MHTQLRIRPLAIAIWMQVRLQLLLLIELKAVPNLTYSFSLFNIGHSQHGTVLSTDSYGLLAIDDLIRNLVFDN